jgi:threonine 3-dehydrogenase
VKIEKAAICGTDLHIYEWNEWAKKRIKKLPLIIGHEFSGVVVEKGEDVEKVELGDFVSGETHVVDESCYQCRTGKMHICRNLKILGVDINGAFAEYILIPELNAWRNNKKLDPRIAAIQEPLGNAVHTIFPRDKVEPVAGKTVLVTGCGPIGLMSIAVLNTVGARKIFATELSEYRLKFAEKMGADVVINPEEDDPLKTIMEETHGDGVDIVLEMSGAEPALILGLRALKPGGRISLLGIFNREVGINWNELVTFKGIHIYGITGRRMFQTWYQVKGLLEIPAFRNKISSLITHEMNMRNIEKGMELLKNKEAVKIILDPVF